MCRWSITANSWTLNAQTVKYCRINSSQGHYRKNQSDWKNQPCRKNQPYQKNQAYQKNLADNLNVVHFSFNCFDCLQTVLYTVHGNTLNLYFDYNHCRTPPFLITILKPNSYWTRPRYLLLFFCFPLSLCSRLIPLSNYLTHPPQSTGNKYFHPNRCIFERLTAGFSVTALFNSAILKKYIIEQVSSLWLGSESFLVGLLFPCFYRRYNCSFKG